MGALSMSYLNRISEKTAMPGEGCGCCSLRNLTIPRIPIALPVTVKSPEGPEAAQNAD
jgi:hypothetical protein